MDELKLYPFQLLDVRLYEIQVERFKDKGPEIKSKEGIPLLLHTEIKNPSEKRAAYFLTLEFSGPLEGNPEYKIRLTVEGMFETEENIDNLNPEIKKDFEDHSGLYLIWPYARECIQNLAARMRENLPLLPTLNRLKINVPDQDPGEELVKQKIPID
jgi:preprotein translocase subunit SecB